MNEFIELSRAHTSDASLLSKIRFEAILALAFSAYGKAGAQKWAESASDGRVLKAIENHEVWVATDGEQAIGWIEIHENTVLGLYVDPKAAGSGVGVTLLLRAEDRISSTGYSTVQLDASLNAEEFYVRHGYQLLSERTPDSGLPMEKKLEAASSTVGGVDQGAPLVIG
ncbi:MAG: GNAT family N-acetyltransferase [Alphaproteobacteria bacterium]|nr:MAG: GNAT family N-acetyltransferase [Alphaproteobacteria bacterium]